MSPIAARYKDEPCVVLAFTADGHNAICAFGPLPGGTFRLVRIDNLKFDLHPQDWPAYDPFWKGKA